MSKLIYPIKLYFKQPIILFFTCLSLALNIFMWFWLLWKIGPQENPIFLHYNILFGVDLIGVWWKVLLFPFTGLFILFINVFLGWIFFAKDKFAAYTLNFISFFCQIFLLIATLLLVFLNV